PGELRRGKAPGRGPRRDPPGGGAPLAVPAPPAAPAHGVVLASVSERRAQSATDDIAVIGIAGRFPDADDLDAFWRNIAAGHDSGRELPADPFDVASFFSEDRRAPGNSYSKWGGCLSWFGLFRPLFF